MGATAVDSEAGVDLLELTRTLVAVPSVSLAEQAIADWLFEDLGRSPWLEVERIGDNVVARTTLGRRYRLVLAGHTDTVPVNAGNDKARVEGDVLWGVGSSDMKSGLAVMVHLARTVDAPAVDLTYVFYVAEEIALENNGLRQLFAQRPDLLACDAAILGEPTDGVIEAGCQGSLRIEVALAGDRAHTARPWMGRNAIHRLGRVLERVAAYEERRPVLAGCEFREALQAVHVSGGVAGNVVPDQAVLLLNHRFAPDRDVEEAVAHVRAVLGDTVEENRGDEVTLLDAAKPAPPGLDHPLLAALAAHTGRPPRAKLGWTDVSFFAEHGIPAINFGPGDPLVAHTRDESVRRGPIDSVAAVLDVLVRTGR